MYAEFERRLQSDCVHEQVAKADCECPLYGLFDDINVEDEKVAENCVHIYTGDGKGKTTAAVGLAVRFAGNGGKVLFTQFLKDGTSSELRILKQIPEITVYSAEKNFGFTFRMDEETKRQARAYYDHYLEEALRRATEEAYGLLVLDEICAAYRAEMINRKRLLAFLEQRPQNLEVVLTGRDPAEELLAYADYVSEVRKIKHPFERGITAREGIEY